MPKSKPMVCIFSTYFFDILPWLVLKAKFVVKKLIHLKIYAKKQNIASKHHRVKFCQMQLCALQNRGQWQHVVTGVACLSKDSNRRSFYIQGNWLLQGFILN